MQAESDRRWPTYPALNLIFYSGKVLSEMKVRFQPRESGALHINHIQPPFALSIMARRGGPGFVCSANMLRFFFFHRLFNAARGAERIPSLNGTRVSLCERHSARYPLDLVALKRARGPN